MSIYRKALEYSAEFKQLGKQRFATMYTHPVLLTANPANEASAGYLTRPTTKQQNASGPSSYANKIGFAADSNYLVIPIVKAEGRPFPDRIGVGRTRNADITLPFNEISKYHAYFSNDGESWTLSDAESSNGTFIDGERLRPITPMALKDGALVAFGARLFLYRAPQKFYDWLATL